MRIADGVELRSRRGLQRPVKPEYPRGGTLRLCLVGGLEARKGQDIALEAVNALKHSGLDVELDLVGREIDASYTAYLHDLVGRLDIRDRVRFVGEVSDVRTHLQSVDIVLAPSRGEWTPLSIMEAMAEQKTVVAADVGSVSDVIADGVTGVLVPPQDPDRLALAVSELAANPEMLSGMGRRASESIERSFDIRSTLDALSDEIQDVLESSASASDRSPGSMRSSPKRLRIAFYGNFGSVNSGNESTLLAILSSLRSLLSEPEFCCICSNPEVVTARDGIEAAPITTRETRIWDREVPIARRVLMAFVGIGAELGQYWRAFWKLRGTDMLIVPGTGLVNDAFGIHRWGPYSMFKWVLMAKLRRTRVLFVSVGAGPVDRPVGRLLVRATLSMADYRSYRDEASRECVGTIGVRTTGDPVYPDLVFGLPDALLRRAPARSEGTRRVVGLGLKVYEGKYSAGDPRPGMYDAYLQALAEFAAWLLEHDYDIRLLLGDADTFVIEDFRAVLRARLGMYDETRVIEQPITTVHDVLAELAATDVVVATRFHNVLLALLLNKPVIAISFHHKCSSLMRQMRLSAYCHEMDSMNADRLITQFRTLEQNLDAVRHTIGQGVDEARAELDRQYELLFVSP